MVVIANATSLFQLNVLAAINIKISQMIGSGSTDLERQKVRSSAICIEFFQQIILVTVLTLLAPFVWDLPERFSTIILWSAGLTIFQTALINLFVGFHESNGSFIRLGAVLPINALIQLLLVWVSISFFGLIGLFGSMLFSLVLGLIVLLCSLKFLRFGAVQPPSSVQSKILLNTAFKFRISDLGTTLFYALDTIIASLLLTPSGLSLFVTAKFMASLSSHAIMAFSRINLVSLGNSVGSEKDTDEISDSVTRQFFLIYIVLAPALILFAGPLFRLFLPIFLPAYSNSLDILPFFMLGILCSSRALFLRNLWIQSNQWRRIGQSGIIALGTSIPILFYGYYFLGSLDAPGLAKVVLFSQLPYALILILMVSKTSCSFNHAVIRSLIFLLSFTGICSSLYFNGSYTDYIYNILFYFLMSEIF